jgi:hypothetical protein
MWSPNEGIFSLFLIGNRRISSLLPLAIQRAKATCKEDKRRMRQLVCHNRQATRRSSRRVAGLSVVNSPTVAVFQAMKR